MKKFVFVLFVLFSGNICFSNTQDVERAKNAHSVVWFGFDFTVARFIGVNETPQQLMDMMGPLNNLVPNESKKYNIAKYFKKQSTWINLSNVNKRNNEIDPSDIISYSPIELSEKDIQKVVNGYKNESDKAETGLLFIVENCNKSTLSASVYVCFFDISSGEIFYMKNVYGKPKGFGLRNFWAGAMHQIMEKWKY